MIIDKDGEIIIILNDNNEEYYLDDFIKIFSKNLKDKGMVEDFENNNEENIDVEIVNDNKDIIRNISDISHEFENKKESIIEGRNNENKDIKNEEYNEHDENGMKKENNSDF